jgi:hypothetical protein
MTTFAMSIHDVAEVVRDDRGVVRDDRDVE